LTDGGLFEAGSAFYSTPVHIDQSFTTDFTFQLSSSNPSILANIADGITFTMVNSTPGFTDGPFSLGDAGGSLGYAGIYHNPQSGTDNFSVAFKFDLHNNAGEGTNSTGIYFDGAPPTIPAYDLTSSGIDLHSGHPFHVHITFNDDGGALIMTLTDTVTQATYTLRSGVDLAAVVGSSTAYVGFTGATGGQTAVQQILNWTFANP
jgi:hypothetical protein